MLFANSREKKIITATMITAVFLFSIYLLLINLKLAIAFLIFMSICFLAFMVFNTVADKDLKGDVTQQDKDLKVESTSNNEEQNVGISAEEQKRIQTERAKKYMEEGLPLGPIDLSGNPISSKAQGVENGCSVDDTQTMVVPYTISLGTHDKTQNGQLDLAGKMTSLPTHMNVIGGTVVPQNNVNTAMKSTDRVHSKISQGLSCTRLMQSPPAHMNAFGDPISSSQAGIRI
ncbi:MAG: hypothetical protein PG981_000399 [Wolbachia endosymbiont of Ctenocephalides orientis wCori]|nr:MAG: hypothetical protein PG981_000399 [Wolbachia endosymbiont of Ctenocephalides orientis wCori]